MRPLSVLAGALLLLAPATPAAAAPATPDLATTFARAAAAYDVPRDLLAAIGFSETRLLDHDGKPSQDNGYGVMHLADNPANHSLTEAAALTGVGVPRLKSDPAANVRGAAAVLNAYAVKIGMSRADRHRIAAWYPAVAAFAGASSDATARVAADQVYSLLRQGIDGPVRVAPRTVRPELGRYADVTPAGQLSTGQPQQATALAAAAVPQYPPAHWVAANGSNYSPGRSSAISTIVIHVTQGSYAGTISWFQNPSAQVSAHYVVRSSDGDITQMVREEDTAYHVRDANSYAIGIEHEGYVDDPGWFTDSMYRSSAALTRYLADKWGLPKNRTAIKGHNEMPGNDHTDPGGYWNWDYYMSLVNSGGQPVAGASTDFTGDGKDDIVTFTLGTLNDAYVATSTGTSFAGTSVKWNDYFGLTGETLLSGDFNGDGKDDAITFTGGSLGDVYVGLSTGSSFAGGVKWDDWFAPGVEVPAVGDVNGDGKDDVISFTHNAEGDVWVALSTGTSFTASTKWHDFFALTGEIPAAADVNGDGKDDIITFTRGPGATLADVYVALSTGTSFGASAKWHDLFAVGSEQPRVGDVDGDGKADIVSFTCDSNADAYVALSNGTSFVGTGLKWSDYFCLGGEFPFLGDYNGDGKADAITFTKGSTNDVWVGLSTGTSFNGGVKWHDFFGLPGEATL